MKRDRWRMRRILLQYEQTSSFKTKDPCDAYHVALLFDEGYAVGEVMPQDGIPQEVEIYRLTNKGHTALQNDLAFFSAAIDNQGVKYEKGVKVDDSMSWLMQLRLENEKFRDATLRTVSIGGIGLAFSVISFLMSKEIFPFSVISLISLIVAIVSWVVILVLLLVSANAAVRTIDLYLEAKSDALKSDKSTQRMNYWNVVLMCVGILAFALFLFTINVRVYCVCEGIVQ